MAKIFKTVEEYQAHEDRKVIAGLLTIAFLPLIVFGFLFLVLL